MKTRFTLMIGMAAISLMMALPAQAAPDYVDNAYMNAKRNIDDGVSRDRQDPDRENRKSKRRNVEDDDPQGYGYGYERRQRGYDSPAPVYDERPGNSRGRGRR